MTAHTFEIEPYNHMPEDGPKGTAITYQWVCSCGRRGPLYVTSALSARRGGERHVAAMERG
jgi:hypothetical protein